MNKALDEATREQLLEDLVDEISPTLKSCSPENGIGRFLSKKEPEVTAGTLSQYELKLTRFLDFCRERQIEDLRELDGRILDDYRQWLRTEGSDEVEELSRKTMQDDLSLLRECVSYWESISAVSPRLSDSITIPDMPDQEGVRNNEFDADRLGEILNYLAKYQYATLDHVVVLLLGRTGRRTGGIHSLDVEDAHLGDDPYLEFRHDPPGTRLKNGVKSEGHVAISQNDAEIIADYIDTNRPEVIDDQDREPLLATRHGRVAKSTIRRITYSWTRPCEIGNGCPHDRDPDECDAAQSRNAASKCPSSQNPHAFKHGYISTCRRQGIPIDIISDRCDVSEEVLRKHYDESTNEDRREIRRRVLDEYADDNGGGYL